MKWHISLLALLGVLGLNAAAVPAAAAPARRAVKRSYVAPHRHINCALCAADPTMQWESPNARLGGLSCDFRFNARWWHLNGKYSHAEYLAILSASAGSFIRDVPLPKGWVGVNNWLDKWGNPYTYPKGGGLYHRDADPRHPTVDLIFTPSRPNKPYMFRSDGDRSCNNLMEGPPPPYDRPTPPPVVKKWEIDILKTRVVCDHDGCTEDHFANQTFSFYRYENGQIIGEPYNCRSTERRVKVFVEARGTYHFKEVLTHEQRDAGYGFATFPDGLITVTIDDSSSGVTEVKVENSFHHPKRPEWEVGIEKEDVLCDHAGCRTDHFGSEAFTFCPWKEGHISGEPFSLTAKVRQYWFTVYKPGTYQFKEVLTPAQREQGYDYLSCAKTDGVITVTITENSPTTIKVKVTNLFRHPREVVHVPPPPPLLIPAPVVVQAPIPPLPYNAGNGSIRTYETHGPQIGVAFVRCSVCGKRKGTCNHTPPSSTPSNGNPSPGKDDGDGTGTAPMPGIPGGH